jgi:hypothetical protein
VLPLGNYADGYYAALGIFGRYEKALGPRAFTTVRLGFLQHLVKDYDNSDAEIRVFMIPLFFGARYNFAPTGQGLFLVSEGGINVIVSSISIPSLGIEDSSTSAKFTANLGVGFQTGTISSKATLFVTTRAGADTEGNSTSLFGLMVSIGVDFAAL